MGTLASKLDARSVFMESRPSWRHNSACSQRAVSLYSLWHSGDREWLGGDRPGRIEMFECMFWVTGDTGDGWEKKIPVVDPDPVGFCLCFVSSTLGTTTSTLCQAPTIWTVLDGWAANLVMVRFGSVRFRDYFARTPNHSIGSVQQFPRTLN